MERDISVLPTEMTRPFKEDRLQSWSRMFRLVPTENFWILGWMESASKKFFYTRISEKKKRKLCGSEIFKFKIGTLRSDEEKKWIYVLSAFIAIIPTHFLYQK